MFPFTRSICRIQLLSYIEAWSQFDISKAHCVACCLPVSQQLAELLLSFGYSHRTRVCLTLSTHCRSCRSNVQSRHPVAVLYRQAPGSVAHWSTNLSHWYNSARKKIPTTEAGIEPGSSVFEGDSRTTGPARRCLAGQPQEYQVWTLSRLAFLGSLSSTVRLCCLEDTTAKLVYVTFF